jgi:hypothetical protein
VSELERKPMYAIKRLARVLDLKVQNNKKQTKKNNKFFYTNNKKQTKRTSVFTLPNLNDTLSPMWQEIQYPRKKNRNVQRLRCPPNFNTNTHQQLTAIFSQMNKH